MTNRNVGSGPYCYANSMAMIMADDATVATTLRDLAPAYREPSRALAA